MEARGVGSDSLKRFLADNPQYVGEVYDYSQLALWDQCHRKYSYRYIDEVSSKIDPSAIFSTYVMHPVIAALFQDAVADYANLIKAGWEQFVLALNKATPMTAKHQQCYAPNPAYTALLQVEDKTFLLRDTHTFVNTETLYWRTLPNVPDAIWVSKPDVVLARKEDGKLVTVEIKTSMYDFTADLNPFDRQILSQAWTVEPIKQIKLFIQFCFDSKSKFGGTIVYPENGPLKPMQPDAILLSEWLAEVEFEVDAIKRAKQSGVWVKRSPSACRDFNRDCPMLDLCLVGASRKFLASGMEHDNPLEYLGL